jgi:hypothetical protein
VPKTCRRAVDERHSLRCFGATGTVTCDHEARLEAGKMFEMPFGQRREALEDFAYAVLEGP